jgi:hypothetical protein
MEYKRNCPNCGETLTTPNKYWHKKAEKQNKPCLSCSLKGKPKSETAKRNMRKNHADFSGEKNPFWGKHHSVETIEKMKPKLVKSEDQKKVLSSIRKEWHKQNQNAFKGKTHSKETKQKLSHLTSERFNDEEFREKFSKIFIGRTHPMKGKKGYMSEESRKRMSDGAKKRITKYGNNQFHSYNPNSIPIIESFGKQNGYRFQHAENGGEYQVPGTTFFVDGYDKENNVVIEYDEKYHYSEPQQQKDKQRQDMIGIILKCKFIRIDENGECKIFEYMK